MLINFTNHPCAKWGEDQLAAAKEQFGEIKDMPFPAVPENADELGIEEMAEKVVEDICRICQASSADDVLVQGEFTLAFAVIIRLQAMGRHCYAACSKRETVETQAADGSTVKNAVFRFVRFRHYDVI